MAKTKAQLHNDAVAAEQRLQHYLIVVGANDPSRPVSDPLARLLHQGLPIIAVAAEIMPRRVEGNAAVPVLETLRRLWQQAVGKPGDDPGPLSEAGLRTYLFNIATALLRYHYARIKQNLPYMRVAMNDVQGAEDEVLGYLKRQAAQRQAVQTGAQMP